MRQNRPATPRSRPSARGPLSHALILLTLVAFTFQSFVTQTHIHARPVGAPVAVDPFDGVPTPAKDKAPAKDDEASCPLCQAFASAGNFVTPAAAAAILLPAFSVSVITLAAVPANLAPGITHIWRGRAPPAG